VERKEDQPMKRVEGPIGVLEALARAELDALLDRVAAVYRPGTLEALSVADPAWRASLDQAECEAGRILRELRSADAALRSWRGVLDELARGWERVTEPHTAPETDGAEMRMLEEVA
jgi:hypothetical protein